MEEDHAIVAYYDDICDYCERAIHADEDYIVYLEFEDIWVHQVCEEDYNEYV